MLSQHETKDEILGISGEELRANGGQFICYKQGKDPEAMKIDKRGICLLLAMHTAKESLKGKLNLKDYTPNLSYKIISALQMIDIGLNLSFKDGIFDTLEHYLFDQFYKLDEVKQASIYPHELSEWLKYIETAILIFEFAQGGYHALSYVSTGTDKGNFTDANEFITANSNLDAGIKLLHNAIKKNIKENTKILITYRTITLWTDQKNPDVILDLKNLNKNNQDNDDAKTNTIDAVHARKDLPQFLPYDFYEAIKTAAKQGFLLGFLSTLSKEIVGSFLEEENDSSYNALILQILEASLMLLAGHSIQSTIGMQLMRYVLSKQHYISENTIHFLLSGAEMARQINTNTDDIKQTIIKTAATGLTSCVASSIGQYAANKSYALLHSFFAPGAALTCPEQLEQNIPPALEYLAP